MVLLAYYIAAINIEAAYHGVVGGDYQPFEGICLTDTFQLYEKEDLISNRLENNSTRRKRQKKLDIRVIIGNPPYSVGQKSANDNNQNIEYPALDARIAETYARRSSAVLKNALYDSYVRALRWASDRVGSSGVIGFVTNAGFIEATTADGLRKCLAEEFSSLYVFHLRGNQRTAGELSKREGGKVFGSGSRAPVAISLLVKNPNATDSGRIFFRDVGDYLTREQKLEMVREHRSIAGLGSSNSWIEVHPDAHGDWLKQRDESFECFIVMGDKTNPKSALFDVFSNGVKTNRDAWAYAYSPRHLEASMRRAIDFYNGEVARWRASASRPADVDSFIDSDPTKFSWDRPQRSGVERGRLESYSPAAVRQSQYRPFTSQWLYFDSFFNNCVYKMPRLYPDRHRGTLAIGVSGSESRSGFSALMTGVLPSLHAADMVGSQYFPLYVYDVAGDSDEDSQGRLFADSTGAKANGPVRRDAITDAGFAHFTSAYPGESITKEDLFYYVYGILYSSDYRRRYADNLGKELPRIPRVKAAADFWAFSKAGRELGELHVGYEKVPEHPATVEISVRKPTAETYRVESMRFGKGEKVDGKTPKDKTTVVYNDFITVKNIPLEAYEYVVNGKSAIEWVMERQGVSTDKASGIVKDANDYAIETMNDPRYPLSLLLRVITVSLETVRIVKSLPTLDVREDG